MLRARVRGLVREQPWLAVAAAAAAGGILGGLWFSRAGRLAFAAATGVVAHELWRSEGRLAVSDVVAKLASLRGGRPRRGRREEGERTQGGEEERSR